MKRKKTARAKASADKKNATAAFFGTAPEASAPARSVETFKPAWRKSGPPARYGPRKMLAARIPLKAWEAWTAACTKIGNEDRGVYLGKVIEAGLAAQPKTRHNQ